MKGILLAGGSGAHESSPEAADFIKTLEKRQGLKMGCIKEPAFRKGLPAEQPETIVPKNIPQISQKAKTLFPRASKTEQEKRECR
jgi:glucose-1-phosphate thymidylyltransferase